ELSKYQNMSSWPDVVPSFYDFKVVKATLVHRNWIYNRPAPKKADFVSVKRNNRTFTLIPKFRIGLVSFRHLGMNYTAYVPYSSIFKVAIGVETVQSYLDYIKTGNRGLIPENEAKAACAIFLWALR
ncbi:unnamed protein product, partial [Allacma fusca]